jgi:hypothetical protein
MAEGETIFIPGAEVRGEVAADTSTAGGTVPASQPKPVGDRLAAILQKQANGETLTASERGYLGAVKRKGLGKKKPAVAVADTNELLEVQPAATGPAPAPAGNELFEAGPAAQASAVPDAAALDSAADEAAIQEAAFALLDTLDSATKSYIADEARAAGCSAENVARYETAVALKSRNRDLMGKNSKPVVLVLCKVFRCTPEKLPGVIKGSSFVIGLWSHLAGIRTVVKSLRESQQEKAAA